MPLRAVLDSLDAAPEALREHYTERDGKYVLDLDGVDDHPTVRALKNAHTRTKDESRKLREELGRFQAIAKDPDELEARLAEGGKGADPDALRRAIEKARKEVAAEFEPKVAEGQKYRDRFYDLRVKDAVRSAALKGGAMKDRVDDLLATYTGRFKYEEDKDRIVVIDGDGDPTGESLEEFFARKAKREKPWFFEGSGSSGSGGGSGREPAPAGTISRGDESAFLANIDQIAAGKLQVK